MSKARMQIKEALVTTLTPAELEMRAACVGALRARAGYLEDNGYEPVSVAVVRHAAYWLGTDEGLFAVCAEYDAKDAPDSPSGEKT